ncbi:tyrosine-type recombinase/integrase [Nocardioides sp.]|uniref:tyrosine-type recombinase/integrase n=1 Tax=Nocardioides sp. TaxID=35761 RepID=UPI00356569D9
MRACRTARSPMQTCLEFAEARLQQRSIKESTFKEYLATLRVLGLADVPYETVTLAMLNSRLSRVLTASTRRKHAINLRACLGLPVPCPKAAQKVYALPPLPVLHNAVDTSSYRLWGFVMLYGGLRLGEACANQPIIGTVLTVDRQRKADGTLASAKTCGPVVLPDWLADEYRAHDFERAANTVYVGIRRAGRRAGVEIRPHLLRHAFATNLVAAGATPEVLRRQMRHHDVAVSLRYYVQTTESQVAETVARMSSCGLALGNEP